MKMLIEAAVNIQIDPRNAKQQHTDLASKYAGRQKLNEVEESHFHHEITTQNNV